MGFPRKNTEVGCHFLLQGIFLIQGSNLCFLHWQANSLPLSLLGSYKQDNTKCGLMYNRMFPNFSHVVIGIGSLFLFIAERDSTAWTESSADGHVSCLYLLAVVKKPQPPVFWVLSHKRIVLAALGWGLW